MADGASRRRITKQVVDTLKPGRIVWDAGKGSVSGFGVRCQRDPGRKMYVFKTRIAGRQRWFTIGRHGSPWTPESARDKARSIAGQVVDDVDVASIRDEQKRQITVAELCDIYMADAELGKILTRRGEPKKSSTLVIDRGRISRHIKPLMGDLSVASVTSEDIEQFQTDIATGATAKTIEHDHGRHSVITGGKGTATRTVGLLGGIFSYAVKKRLRSGNPVRGIQRFRDREMERFLSSKEWTRLGKALAAAEAGNPFAVAAIRLLALTGCRKGEVLALRWTEIDFENGVLRLAESKTGAKVIPVGAPALQLLAGLPRLENNPFVFPGRKPDTHLSDLFEFWKRIREQTNLEDVRLHDLRHSFASTGAGRGESLYIIGSLLGHRDAKTTQRYSHVPDDPRRAAADRISENIAAAMRGDEAEVVNIDGAKKRG